MKVSAHISALSRTQWYEYLPRFLFGGLVTALAGVVARKFGPSIGGLMLAFPAIFPATATLIEKHEKKEKHATGYHGKKRGRRVAGVDAVGASMGAMGLIVFALLVWKLVLFLPVWAVLLTASLGWGLTSLALWKVLRG